MIRSLRPLLGLLSVCLLLASASAQEGTAFRTSLGTALDPAADGTPRYREETGWSNANFGHNRWALEYGTTLSASPWIAVLQAGRTNAAFTAAANQLTLDLGGGTYAVAPYFFTRVHGGRVTVVDRFATGSYLKVVNGTFNNEFGSNALTVVGDSGLAGRLFVENGHYKSYSTLVSGALGSSGFLTLETGGQFSASKELHVAPLGTGTVLLRGAGSTLTAGHVAIGGSAGGSGLGSITLDNSTAVLRTSTFSGNTTGDLLIDNPIPAQPGNNTGLTVRAGLVQVEGNLNLATAPSARYGAVSIEGGTVAVAGNVRFDGNLTETSGGKMFLRDGRIEVTAPTSLQPAAQQNFYWDAGTVAFSNPNVSLSDVQLQNYTRQGAISYGGDRAAGTLATGQVLESAGTLTLTGNTIGLAGGTIRAATRLTLNAPLAGHGVLDAVVSGVGAITNPTTNSLSIGALDGTNAISSAGELQVGSRNVDATFAGTSSGAGLFAKTGASTQTITGTVTNLGGIEVREGALLFDGPGPRLATSTINVSDAALMSLINGATGTADAVSVGSSPTAFPAGRLAITGPGSSLTVATGLTNNGWIEITGGSLDVGGSFVNQGRLINNGLLDASVSGSGIVSGSGTFAGPVTIADGGMLAPGNSPGTANFLDLTLGAGGSFELELAAATGTAGTDWDLAIVTDVLTIAATAADPYSIVLKSLDGSLEPGALAGFDAGQSFSWKFLSAALPDPQAIDLAAFRLDGDAFAAFNDLGSGTFAVSAASDGLYVGFAPPPASVPEPGSAVLLLVSGTAASLLRRTRRPKSKP